MSTSPESNEQDYKPLIMVVDDNPEFLSGIELTLEMEGFRVITANDGQHALDKLRTAFVGQNEDEGNYERLPDLILGDIMMPVMDGYEFYEEIRANPYTNHIPFIFLTAKSSDANIRHGKELGADDYLSKLSSPEDLLASVRGKLKRVEQRRSLAAQFSGDPTQKISSGFIIFVVLIVALIALAFCVGALLPFS